jgi:hypothetical protein
VSQACDGSRQLTADQRWSMRQPRRQTGHLCFVLQFLLLVAAELSWIGEHRVSYLALPEVACSVGLNQDRIGPR